MNTSGVDVLAVLDAIEGWAREVSDEFIDGGDCRAEYAGDLRAATEARATVRELIGTLEMVRDAVEDAKADGLRTIPEAARARIDAALVMAGRE